MEFRQLASTGSGHSVLIVSPDTVADKMAGPGIRYWEMARALSANHRVTLTIPGKDQVLGHGVEVVGYGGGAADCVRSNSILAELVPYHDVIVLSGALLDTFPCLGASNKKLIVDLYIPYFFESLACLSADSHFVHEEDFWSGIRVMRGLIDRGDFFVCASERQRDLFLGMLLVAGRISPGSYAQDRSLDTLIAIVPFGLPEQPPRHRKKVMKGVHHGIAETDRVILWGGGVWQWLDPLTAIRAMPAVLRAVPQAKLWFLGTQHPSEMIPDMPILGEARKLSEDLGLTNRAVFFGDWVSYDDRENFLLEADVGLSLHVSTLETRFAFRTRVLDYIWAGLPMVVSGGDVLSDQVMKRDLALVVEPGDTAGVAAALVCLLSKPDLRQSLRQRFQEFARGLGWSSAIHPIERYLADPMGSGGKADNADNQSALLRFSADRDRLQATIEYLEANLDQREGELLQLKKHLNEVQNGRVMRCLNLAREILSLLTRR